jgi:hypothetical protein
MEAGEKHPRLPRPSRVVERMVPAALLMRQFRIAELDRPLLDVEAELRIVDAPKRARSSCAATFLLPNAKFLLPCAGFIE